jgi:AAA domain
MTNEQKGQVRDALMRYVAGFATQTQAAESLQGVSASTISQVRNNNWELLSERLWHHIARQVGFYCGEWQPADTTAYLLLRVLFSDAQHYFMTYGISIGEGLGKTFTASHYMREHADTYYLACTEEHNRRSFLVAVMKAIGFPVKGSVPQMMERFVLAVEAQAQPLLILDDAHKLKDRVLHLLVLLANSVAGRAGFIIMGNDLLRERLVTGMQQGKAGFEEMYKAIGRRFITYSSIGPKDVELVCSANGITDTDLIDYIRKSCNDNLHTATQLIHELQTKTAA